MGNEKVLESPKKKYASVRISIQQARFTYPSSFPFLSSSHPSSPLSCFSPQWKIMRSRIAECTQFIANRAWPLSVYLVFACVSHAIKQEEVRSMLNTRLNARHSTIRHCVSFFEVCFLALCLSFSATGFSHAKSHVCTIKLILYDVEIDLIICDKHIPNTD